MQREKPYSMEEREEGRSGEREQRKGGGRAD